MEFEQVLEEMKAVANPKSLEGMKKFGINTKKAYGVSIPDLRKLAKTIGKNHELAQRLWDSQIHEGRILASMIDDVNKVTEEQMDSWTDEFDSWDVCDQVCSNLFDKTEFAHMKAIEWTRSKKEFVKRAGFAMMAVLAVHDKNAKDESFEKFFSIIHREATDERNFVKKSVNWALRQIGKRNRSLNKKTIALAKEMEKMDSKSAKWIASDALRELKKKSF